MPLRVLASLPRLLTGDAATLCLLAVGARAGLAPGKALCCLAAAHTVPFAVALARWSLSRTSRVRLSQRALFGLTRAVAECTAALAVFSRLVTVADVAVLTLLDAPFALLWSALCWRGRPSTQEVLLSVVGCLSLLMWFRIESQTHFEGSASVPRTNLSLTADGLHRSISHVWNSRLGNASLIAVSRCVAMAGAACARRCVLAKYRAHFVDCTRQ